jgi:hypothetical protein
MSVATQSPNPIDELIQSKNPFDGHIIVKSQQIWGEEFPDITSLNSHVSEAVCEAVEHSYNNNTVRGIAILASRGVGKTHVLSRIRHILKRDGKGIFIYASEYGNLSRIKTQFLNSLTSSLKKLGSQSVLQCQEIATLIVNESFDKNYQPQQIRDQFLKVLNKNPKLVDKLQSKALCLGIEIDDPYVLKAMLWCLSPEHVAYAINWLAGREISEARAREMGLPEISAEDQETLSFRKAIDILKLISRYSVPVICFDELDGAEQADESAMMFNGFTRAMVVASLVKDIYNNSVRGVIVTAMYPLTWKSQVDAMGGADANAIKDRVGEQQFQLDFPNEDEVIALVSGWLRRFYDQHGVTPETHTYPFDENELRKLARSKPTVRRLLRWCAENFGPPIKLTELLEKLWLEAQKEIGEITDDNDQIANALTFGLNHLRGETLENVLIEEIDQEVCPKSVNGGYIQFRILGQENGEAVKIGVCVLQNSHGRGVGAGLRRLIQYNKFDLTRGCLIRNKDIPERWSAYDNVNKMTQEMGGEWIKFEDPAVKKLLALREILKDREDYDISGDVVEKFVREKAATNKLICEILSDPSGMKPEGLEDEESNVIEFPRTQSEAIDSSDNTELDDPFAEEAI